MKSCIMFYKVNTSNNKTIVKNSHYKITYYYIHFLSGHHIIGFNTRNAHMVHIVNLIRFKMVYTSK